MKNNELNNLIDDIRNIALQEGVDNITLDKLLQNPLVNKELLEKHFTDDKDLAKGILDNERLHFENIFDDKNFKNNNAIDNLIIVSEMIAENFNYLIPSIYAYYQQQYPEIHQVFFEQKTETVYNRIRFNLNRGIWQGYYRDDLSIELVARGYISRLIDLYNPDTFPPEKFSFDDFFSQMMKTFVLSIVTSKGLAYWNKKMQESPFAN